jgi:hypothetical protein
MKLLFGKFKGQELSSTPQWYQNWLSKQDWFNPNQSKSITSNTSYALLECGSIHTDDLDLDSANEMLERHKRCFPNSTWVVVPMSTTKGLDKLEGMLERHARISAKY